jgi:hypothetical protein
MSEVVSAGAQGCPTDTDPGVKGVASCGNKSTDDTESNDENISAETPHIIDSKAERALCRKFDFRLLPVLAVMVRLIPLRLDQTKRNIRV